MQREPCPRRRACAGGGRASDCRTMTRSAASRCSCTGLSRSAEASASGIRSNRFTIARVAGTRTPTKTSPSPYSPGPVLKKRAGTRRRRGRLPHRWRRRVPRRSAAAVRRARGHSRPARGARERTRWGRRPHRVRLGHLVPAQWMLPMGDRSSSTVSGAWGSGVPSPSGERSSSTWTGALPFSSRTCAAVNASAVVVVTGWPACSSRRASGLQRARRRSTACECSSRRASALNPGSA